jgi:hypothetical protein
VGDKVPVTVIEDTRYPFEESARFTVQPARPVAFTLRLRHPIWATNFEIRLNDQPIAVRESQRFLALERVWNPGDRLEIQFITKTEVTRWVENSVAVQRGPLLYSLKIGEDWTKVAKTDGFGEYLEVRPTTPWNYGLLESAVKNPSAGFELRRTESPAAGTYPWTQETAPLELASFAKRIPEWQLYGNRAGPLPHSRPSTHLATEKPEAIRLIPYGCTRLRITEFPVVR